MARPPDRELVNLLSAFDPSVVELALALREMLREEAPGAVEKIYRNHPSAIWFGFGPEMKNMFSYVAAATRHVNLGFCRGALLPDPNQVLEGEGNAMRHIKFRTRRDLERSFVRRYIRRAIEQAGRTSA